MPAMLATSGLAADLVYRLPALTTPAPNGGVFQHCRRRRGDRAFALAWAALAAGRRPDAACRDHLACCYEAWGADLDCRRRVAALWCAVREGAAQRPRRALRWAARCRCLVARAGLSAFYRFLAVDAARHAAAAIGDRAAESRHAWLACVLAVVADVPDRILDDEVPADGPGSGALRVAS